MGLRVFLSREGEGDQPEAGGEGCAGVGREKEDSRDL
jgi:hypothetical protein